MNVLELVQKAAYVWNESADIADNELFLNAPVDEVAILFSSEANLVRFARLATEGGLEHFNSVKRDLMRRQDTLEPEDFYVRFEFLRIPGAPWRIEAMCVLEGTAPLHEQHLAQHGNGSIVHASYKCEDIDSYHHAVNVLRTEMGAGAPAVAFHAEYRNTYGIFSYWGEEDYYFKPRVNLRDR